MTHESPLNATVTATVVGLLLAAFFVQAVSSMRLMTASSDETVHLPAGYTYIRTGQLRLNPEHPPLMKELCAAPLLFLGPRLDLSDSSWRAEPPDQTRFGYDFLYSNDADRLLFWGRMPVVLLGLVLGIYVYRWASQLFGRPAGLMALFLYAFSPNLIAHSRFVTMDLGLSCFFVICLYHLWRYVRRGGRANLLLAGVGLGLALGAKFSGVILIPTVALLLALAVMGRTEPRQLITEADRERPGAGADATGSLGAVFGTGPLNRQWRIAGAALVVLLAVTAILVWAIYLFPLDPLFYWDGMKQVNKNHRPDYAEYLMGEFEVEGWWYYFLVAFLVKTPVPTLVLLVLSAALFKRQRSEHSMDEAFLVLPAAIFLATTSAAADNIGLRYILPLYPLVFIFVSRLAPFFAARRWGIAAMAVLGAWYMAGAARIYPDHLAYFNELTGGPGNGHKYLDDSNIDWGQDLKRLRDYLDEHGIERVKLLPGPWKGNPGYYGIRWEPVRRQEWRGRPLPGVYYAVSTHMLVRGELIARRQGTNNNWLSRYEPVGRVGYSFYIFKF